MDAEGRRLVVITGAARGIGRAIALSLAGRGDHVVVTDIDELGAHTTARTADALAGKATGFGLDVRHRVQFDFFFLLRRVAFPSFDAFLLFQ